MRVAVLFPAFVLAGCIGLAPLEGPVFDVAAWERQYVGQPASFFDTGGGGDGRGAGDGWSGTRVNLTLQPPTVMCHIANATSVSCTSVMPWNASAGSTFGDTELRADVVGGPDPSTTCQAPTGSSCGLDGTLQLERNVTAADGYVQRASTNDNHSVADLTFTSRVFANATTTGGGAELGSSSLERSFREEFEVRFTDGHPVPDPLQRPIQAHGFYGPNWD